MLEYENQYAINTIQTFGVLKQKILVLTELNVLDRISCNI